MSAEIHSPGNRSLWSHCAPAWAELQEPQMMPLYDIILKAVPVVRPGHRLLDLGCASGIFCARAAQSGLEVTGLDLCRDFVNTASARVPHATFHERAMEATELPDESQDTVTCLNSLYYSSSPLDTACEAYRLLKPGGRFVVASWGQPDRCDASRLFTLLYTLAGKHPSPWHSPFAFSQEGVLRSVTQRAGFFSTIRSEAEVLWVYQNDEVALRAVMACEQGRRAVEAVGEDEVKNAVRSVLEPFRLPSGGYRLRNRFTYMIAARS